MRPAGFEELTDAEFRAKLVERLEAGEQALREGRRDRPVLGAKAVLKQHWNSKPKTRAPHFQRIPHIACRDTTLRVQALRDKAHFNAKYRHALKRFIGGARNVLFPYGTLMMRQRYRVRCEKPTGTDHPPPIELLPTPVCAAVVPPPRPPPPRPPSFDDLFDF